MNPVSTATSPSVVGAMTVLEWPPRRSLFSYTVTWWRCDSSQADDRAATPDPTTAILRGPVEGWAYEDDIAAPNSARPSRAGSIGLRIGVGIGSRMIQRFPRNVLSFMHVATWSLASQG